MAYKITQSNIPPEFNSGLPPVLYADSGGLLLGDSLMKFIPLTQGKFAIVDDEDYEWLNQWKWYVVKDGRTYYAVRSSSQKNGQKKRRIWMHREIIQPSKYTETDHINRNGLDNQRINLRVCTRSQNHQNQFVRKGGTSQYKGVWWEKSRLKWKASIGLNHKNTCIGRFEDEIEAAKAYNHRAKELFGEFALFNNV